MPGGPHRVCALGQQSTQYRSRPTQGDHWIGLHQPLPIVNRKIPIKPAPTTRCSGHAVLCLAGSVGAHSPLQDSSQCSDGCWDVPLRPWNFCHWDDGGGNNSIFICLMHSHCFAAKMHRPNSSTGKGQLHV